MKTSELQPKRNGRVRSSELVRRHDLGLVTRLVRVPDNAATGQLMREARKRAGLSLREMARRLGQSAPFVSDLELGRRGWDEKRIAQWADVLVPPNDEMRDRHLEQTQPEKVMSK